MDAKKTGNFNDGSGSWKLFPGHRRWSAHAVRLTHLVNSLERRVGSTIVRSQNGISLTEQGRELMPDIRQFLQANASLENRIQGIREKQMETIRIAATPVLPCSGCRRFCTAFTRICPNVDVDLRMVDHALEPYELLQDGKTDVIFASKQIMGPGSGHRFIMNCCTPFCRNPIR